MKIRCSLLIGCLIVILVLTAGCAHNRDLAPGTVTEGGVVDSETTGMKDTGAVIESRMVTATTPVDTTPPADYIVGPLDLLSINVNGKREYSSMANSKETVSVEISSEMVQAKGCRVDGNGNIQLPYVGTIHVQGMTLLEIQKRLVHIYSKYLKNHWVIVDIQEYRSHPLHLLGSFRNQGTFFMDKPIRLLEGIALGGGYESTADLTAAKLIREKKTLPVNIYSLLNNGDETQNVWLKAGDTIFIPDRRSR